MKKKFIFIITNTNRSFTYLNLFKMNKIYPRGIIFLDNSKKNATSFKIKKILKSLICPIKIFKTNNINNNNIVKCLKDFNFQYIVYSGYPGSIIKNTELLRYKIIHSHTGRLPKYKGSTTIFYSLLNEKKIYCSTILLNKGIDSGPILLIKRYPLPKKIADIDDKYDDRIRGMNIVIFLKSKKKIMINRKYIINHKKYLPYYIMHPVLRYITMIKFQKNT